MKKNKILWVIVVLSIVITTMYMLSKDNCTDEACSSTFNPKNTSFTIDGVLVTLKNGVSETLATPGSASRVTTRYFGNDVVGDLNGDGEDDVAFLVTQDTGGSGLFYYAVVALQTHPGHALTNAFLIGDRIAPQNNKIVSGELHVNFAERKEGESMTVPPSVGAVLLLRVTPENKLVGLMQ